jgi:hypothetical protein
MLLFLFLTGVLATPFAELATELTLTCEYDNWTWEETSLSETPDYLTLFILQLLFGWMDLGNVYLGYYGLSSLLILFESLIYITWDIPYLKFSRNLFISLICCTWIVNIYTIYNLL